MKQIDIHMAKTHLSALVEKAATGESFVITKSGLPLVVVHPYTPNTSYPRVGFLKGFVSIPADFDRMGSKEIPSILRVVSEATSYPCLRGYPSWRLVVLWHNTPDQ